MMITVNLLIKENKVYENEWQNFKVKMIIKTNQNTF